MIYPTKGRHWADGQDVVLQTMNEWCDYELRDIGDVAKRAELCGIPASDVRQDVKAIVLSKSLEVSKEKAETVYKNGVWPRLYFTNGGQGGIRKKGYLESAKDRAVTNLWPYSEVGHTDEAKKEVKSLIGVNEFETPKPVRLMERILDIASWPDSIVLDAFAGTGTMGHAVMKLNNEDGANRHFILIELEDYAENVTAKRLKHAIEGYKSLEQKEITIYSHGLKLRKEAEDLSVIEDAWTAYNEAKEGEAYESVSKPKLIDGSVVVIGNVDNPTKVNGITGDFSFYELGEPLLTPEGFINESVPIGTIREYVWYMETRTPFIEPKSENQYYLGTANATDYYFCYEREKTTTLDSEFLASLPESTNGIVVYADICTLPRHVMRERNVVFKKIPREIPVM